MGEMTPSEEELRTLEGLRRIVATLRGPHGCPWDRAQTHQSLRHYLREEAAEALEAIESADDERLAEELGDVLLQVFLHAQIAQERGAFSLEDVVYGITSKVVRRHPHVFGSAHAETPEAVVAQWEELKRQEKGDKAESLGSVPPIMPALAQAQLLQGRAARRGFSWPSPDGAWQKVLEEMAELREARTPQERFHELGDLLFAICDLARLLSVDAEDALLAACGRFRTTFHRLETVLKAEGKSLDGMPLEELLAAWKRVKEA